MLRRAVLAAALATPFAARAETTWPTKPIRIVVPFNPGGAIDALVRVIADGLTTRLGQQVLVDPKPGANTIVGSEIVAKAAPDGYTFLITTNSTHTNNPTLYAKLPFDPAKDLMPVSLVSLGTILLVVKADAPFSDLRGMAAWVKQLGRPASYGSWGIGSSGHLYGLMFEKALGGYYNHVPYRGDVPALQDVANGTLDITWASPTSAKTRRFQSLGIHARAHHLCRAADCRLRPQSVRRGLCAGGHADRNRRSPAARDQVGDQPAGRHREADRARPDTCRLDAQGTGRRFGARDADLGRPDQAVRRQGRVGSRP